jgi:C-terminal processing protease CtpA/Prc
MHLDASLVRSKWGRPVVILCNRRSYSATNLFVSMMRYAEKATIIGGVSGGGGGMPMSYEMPCGWMVRFSSVRMFDRDKKDIESGIMPDILVTQQSKDKDDLIEKAIEVINKQ